MRFVLAIALWLSAQMCSAHLMPAQQGTLNVLEKAVFAVIAVPVSALQDGIDSNTDGRLSQQELQHPSLQTQLRQRLRLYDHETIAAVDFMQLDGEPDERDANSLAGGTSFVVLIRFSFSTPPERLRIETDLFGITPQTQPLTIKAIRRKEVDIALLRPNQTTHHFFKPLLNRLADSIKSGVEHILLGADHLLFLLTIIIAGAGWRYWLAVLTSFTVAHSVTLGLALFGLVRISPAIIEPLIASSIVLMAAINLWERTTPTKHRVSIVFICGLLHGLGLADALLSLDLKSQSPWVLLFGFNLGVELGQLVFTAGILAGIALLQKIRHPLLLPNFARLPQTKLFQLVNTLALITSLVWLVQRIAF
jgi:hydrogenase/urease accessory protein HupE